MATHVKQRARKPLTVRLWARIQKAGPNDCWPWIGGCCPRGYGRIGNDEKKMRNVLTHRAAYEDVVGPIPAGLNVLHRCDNPTCCNPAHLWLGTHADNNADMDAKGRRRVGNLKGENNGNAKLTSKQADKIRKAKGSQWDIADRFGVSQSTVSLIKLGKRYAKEG